MLIILLYATLVLQIMQVTQSSFTVKQCSGLSVLLPYHNPRTNKTNKCLMVRMRTKLVSNKPQLFAVGADDESHADTTQSRLSLRMKKSSEAESVA